ATITSVSLGAPVLDGEVATAAVSGSGVQFTAAGGAPFGRYTTGEVMDDLAFSISHAVPAAPTPKPTPTPTPTPTVSVSKTEALVSGDIVTVQGTGFGDQSVLATRPPLAGKFAGFYVAFGAYADAW